MNTLDAINILTDRINAAEARMREACQLGMEQKFGPTAFIERAADIRAVCESSELRSPLRKDLKHNLLKLARLRDLPLPPAWSRWPILGGEGFKEKEFWDVLREKIRMPRKP